MMRSNRICIYAVLGFILIDFILWKTQYHNNWSQLIWNWVLVINFVAYTIFIVAVSILYYKKRIELTFILIGSAILIPMFLLYEQSSVIFKIPLLIFSAICFFVISIDAVVLIYYIKVRKAAKYFRYLLAVLAIVVVNFAGIYSSLYSMYFRYDFEILEIDRDMSYDECLLYDDFLYYSVDCFFSLDVSNVSIKYQDYYELSDLQDKNKDYADMVDIFTIIIKVLTVTEAVLFIIYISIIVTSIPSKEEEDEKKSYNEKVINSLKKIGDINTKLDKIELRQNELLKQLNRRDKNDNNKEIKRSKKHR